MELTSLKHTHRCTETRMNRLQTSCGTSYITCFSTVARVFIILLEKSDCGKNVFKSSSSKVQTGTVKVNRRKISND